MPSFVRGVHPSVSMGFALEDATGNGPAFLIVSFLLFHVRIPLGKKDPDV